MKKCSCVHSYTAGGSILCDPSKKADNQPIVCFFFLQCILYNAVKLWYNLIDLVFCTLNSEI